MFTKNQLEQEYIKNQLTYKQIAQKYRCAKSSVEYYIKKFGIPRRPRWAGQNKKDLTGQRFGMLVVIKQIPNPKSTKANWLCKCDCGAETTQLGGTLLRKLSVSCGCRKRTVGYKGYGDVTGSYVACMRKGAEYRGLCFEIDAEYLWELYQKQNGKCALSGVDISLARVYNNRHEQTASVDRIDSNKGYTKDNVQWVHKTLNVIKWKLSKDDFVHWCNLVSNHNKESK